MEKLEWSLVGVNWNAFAILGYFVQKARRQWRSKEEIKEVLDDAKSGDYDNLLYIINEQFECQE